MAREARDPLVHLARTLLQIVPKRCVNVTASGRGCGSLPRFFAKSGGMRMMRSESRVGAAENGRVLKTRIRPAPFVSRYGNAPAETFDVHPRRC